MFAHVIEGRVFAGRHVTADGAESGSADQLDQAGPGHAKAAGLAGCVHTAT